MSYDLGAFVGALMGDPVLALIVVLTLGATVVNGATDAPNAIATVVGTKAMRPGPAIAMAAVCNFVGLAAITAVSSAVALTIFKMVDFGGDNHAALIALAAAMVAIIVWGVAAWYFGIPTSQSHSLIAGITGAAIALQGGLAGVNGDEWMKVIYGLVISTFLGFGTGWLFTRLIKKLCWHLSRAKANSFFKWAQIISGAGVAVLHGAQDGQKFLSLCMLGIMIGMSGAVDSNVEFPFWLIILVSATMALGTAAGGKKIIKSVGIDPVFFGVFWVVTNEIALLTPPLGVNLFIAMNLSNLPLERVAKGAIPYIFLLILVVFFLILFPDVVTFLPKALGMY